MAYTFPGDSAGKIGAVRPSLDGNDFFVPTVIFGPDGVTPISTTNRLPVDAQITTIKRELAFSTTTPLGANAVYTSPWIDVSIYRTIMGVIKPDQSGSYWYEHSDDTITVLAGNSASAPLGTTVKADSVYLKYIRLKYTNGTTAQTSFQMSFWLSPL